MHITIKGKQIDIGDSLREHVAGKLDEISQKFFEKSIESDVHFAWEGNLHRCDIHMKVPGLTLNSHSSTDDIYRAFDEAAAKIMQRLKRYKNRLKDHHKSAAPIRAVKYVIESPIGQTNELPASEKEEPAPTIIAEVENDIMTLSVNSAIMHMDLADLPALLFFNLNSGQLNMIYRRNDGHIGWVDPAVVASQKTAAA